MILPQRVSWLRIQSPHRREMPRVLPLRHPSSVLAAAARDRAAGGEEVSLRGWRNDRPKGTRLRVTRGQSHW